MGDDINGHRMSEINNEVRIVNNNNVTEIRTDDNISPFRVNHEVTINDDDTNEIIRIDDEVNEFRHIEPNDLRLRSGRVVRRATPYLPHQILYRMQQLERERRRFAATSQITNPRNGTIRVFVAGPNQRNYVYHMSRSAAESANPSSTPHVAVSEIDPNLMLIIRQQIMKRYTVQKTAGDPEVRNGDNCVICMEAYKRDESLYILPCSHKFHQRCIDIWFRKSINCPMCRHRVGGKLVRGINNGNIRQQLRNETATSSTQTGVYESSAVQYYENSQENLTNNITEYLYREINRRFLPRRGRGNDTMLSSVLFVPNLPQSINNNSAVQSNDAQDVADNDSLPVSIQCSRNDSDN